MVISTAVKATVALLAVPFLRDRELLIRSQLVTHITSIAVSLRNVLLLVVWIHNSDVLRGVLHLLVCLLPWLLLLLYLLNVTHVAKVIIDKRCASACPRFLPFFI